MYRSVSVPSNASAANATVSDSVGCGWIVRPMSAASAPISIASADLRDQLAGIAADDAAAEHAMRLRIEQQLGEALVAADRERAAARDPGEQALLERDALRLRFGFGEPDPGHFRIRVGDRRNHAHVERALLPGRDFRGDLAFVRRLVREHRLPDDVADREDVRHVGAHLPIDRNEAALVDRDARRFRVDEPCRSATRPTATSTRS